MSRRGSGPWYTAFFRNGHLLTLGIIVFVVAGFSAVTTLPRLEDPRIDNRNVIVLTPFPGASAERVEALVTDVIEDELRQLHEIKEVKSTSRAGMSVVNVELQAWVDGTTNEQVFSKIRDSLSDAYLSFPDGAFEPELDEKRGATAFTLLIAMSDIPGVTTPMSIKTRLAEELADRFRNVPGTELVRVYGELQEEITVEVDPQQLSSAGLTIEQTSRLIAAADPKLPAGMIRGAQQNTRVQISEELASLDVIRNIPLNVSANAGFMRLGDIAEVTRGWQDPPGDIAYVNGERVVFVAARMQTSVRVDTWTNNALSVVEQFNEFYSGTVVADVVFEQNKYTESRLSDLVQNLLLGCLVVMGVVMIFMGIRSAWIVGLSLPLSAAFAIFSLSFYDEQIHQMSIFGIIIAIGLLIDNAIVITDEIRANLLDRGNTRMQALVKSVRHLFAPLLASTLTTILGFMPIFLLTGNIGDFISSIAISVVMALIGSLFISMTFIAALAARYLPRPRDEQELHWYKRGIQLPIMSDWYKRMLARGIRKPLIPVAVAIALPVTGFILAGTLGNVFFPSADRDQFEVVVWMPEGTSLDNTQSVALNIDERIRSFENVEQVTWLVGGSAPSVYYNQVMTNDNSPNYANAVITASSVSTAAALISELQFDLDEQFPEARVVVRAFGQGPPVQAPLEVEVYGRDLDNLNRLGEEVRLIMSTMPGVTQSIASISMGEPELVIDVQKDVASLAGVPLSSIASQMQASLDGRLGGSILEGTEEIPVRIRLPEQARGDMQQLLAVPIVSQAGAQTFEWIPASALGGFELKPSISSITRIDGIRVNTIRGYLLPGATAVDASNQLQALLQSSEFDLPKGYSIKMGGEAEGQQEALGLLATYLPVLLVLMVTTLILTFSSVKMASVIFSVAVMSVGLGMFSLWLSGLPIGFNPLLGSAGLIGVAINGSIVVIAAINANERARIGDIEEIVKETMSCSRHILSTTFTTVGGLIPLLLFSEGTFWPPLAVVLAGGVGFSVILSLVFTPIVVGKIGCWQNRKGRVASVDLESGKDEFVPIQ